MYELDRKKVAEFLLKNGANIDAITKKKETPLHLAAENGEFFDHKK